MRTQPTESTGSVAALHRSGKNQLLVKLVVVFSSVSVAILLVEASLWLFAPIPFHEWMEWRPDGHIKGRGVPGTSFATADGYEVQINRLGFRGPTPEWEPVPGALRIVTFGGSSTFNYHAYGEAETWPGALQQELNQRLEVPVDVINAALPGFSTLESKINYLTAGRELHPHVVVLYHTWNDMKFLRGIDRSPMQAIMAGVAPQKPLWQRIARHTQLGRRVRNALLTIKKQKAENHYTSLEKEGEAANQMPTERAFGWARRNFEDFARFARADGVLPVLVSQATLAARETLEDEACRLAISNDFVGMTLPITLQTWQRFRKMLEKVAQKEGALYVDGYAAVPHDLEHMRDHVHLTAEGASRLAQVIAVAVAADPNVKSRVDALKAQQGEPSARSDGPN